MPGSPHASSHPVKVRSNAIASQGRFRLLFVLERDLRARSD